MRILILILILILALAFLVGGCATGRHATLGRTVPPEVRSAIEEGPTFETVFHAERVVYRIPVRHLDAEFDAVWRALLAAPVETPLGLRRVGITRNDRVVVRERQQRLEFDSPQLSVVPGGAGYHVDLRDPEDEDHHYLVDFEATAGLDAAWSDLARAAGSAAASAAAMPEAEPAYTLVVDE